MIPRGISSIVPLSTMEGMVRHQGRKVLERSSTVSGRVLSKTAGAALLSEEWLESRTDGASR